MYSLVIFDLDGTLLDTLDDLTNSVNFALRAFSFPERTKEEVRSFIGNGVKKLMERSVPKGTDEKTNENCLHIFREHYLLHLRDNTAAFKGVSELLSELKQKGIKTAVVSNKLHSAVEALCKDYFPDLIDLSLGVSVESERKPNPVNVLKALELLGETTQTAIYVGDSEVDVQTAHAAGLKCIGVTWGFRSKQELQNAECEFIADTCDEIAKIVTE